MRPVTVHVINTTKSEAQAALTSTRGLALNADTRVIIVVAAGPGLRARRVVEPKRKASSAWLTCWPELRLWSSAFCA
jgi:hypothetical protein